MKDLKNTIDLSNAEVVTLTAALQAHRKSIIQHAKDQGPDNKIVAQMHDLWVADIDNLLNRLDQIWHYDSD